MSHPAGLAVILPERMQEERREMLRKMLIVLAAGGITLAATACNTVRGVGQDLESAANTVDEAT